MSPKVVRDTATIVPLALAMHHAFAPVGAKLAWCWGELVPHIACIARAVRQLGEAEG